MCDPATIAMGVGAYGAYRSGKTRQANAQYEAQVEAQNAKIAEMQASTALTRGASTEQNIELHGSQIAGAQRAAQGAENVVLNEGTSARLAASTQYMTDRDVATAKDNAAQEAWGYKIQAGQFSANANMAQSNANAINPLLDATMQGALTGASLYARTNNWKKP